MARGWTALRTGCRLGVLLLIPALPGESEIVLKSECRDSRTLLVQAAGAHPGLVWLLGVSRGGAGPAVVRAGLRSPALTAGPVKRAGLLRLLFRPLGYRPDSDLFREDTGLVLDRGLKPVRQNGLCIEPWPGRLGLFAFSGPGRTAAGGGFLRLEAGEDAFLEALALLSRPPPDEQDGEWLTVPAPYPGGRLFNLGARAGAAFPGLALDLSLVLSGGERTAPGYLALLQAAAVRGRATAALLCGFCSAGYTAPDGRGGQPRRRSGLRVRWGEGGAWQAGALAELVLEPRTEGRLPGLGRELRGELDTRLLLTGCGASWRLEGGITAEARQEGEGGWPRRRSRPEAGLTREGVRNRLALSWAGGGEDRLALEARGGRQGLSWRGTLETRLPEARCFQAAAALELERGAMRLYARLSCRDWLALDLFRRGGAGLAESTAFTLGWETRAGAKAAGP